MECLEHYFDASNITEPTKRKAILLSVCGAKTYKLMRDLAALKLPKDKPFDELCGLVKRHINPVPSIFVQRFRFNSRFCHAEESVSEFVAALRHLTDHCKFGDGLSEMLCYSLVCGVNNEAMQRRPWQKLILLLKRPWKWQ